MQLGDDALTMGKILPPKNSDLFLTQFIREHNSTEYEEVTVDRETVWQDDWMHQDCPNELKLCLEVKMALRVEQ